MSAERAIPCFVAPNSRILKFAGHARRTRFNGAVSLSRRDLIHRFFKPLKDGGEKARTVLARSTALQGPTVAIIQGRFCLAYHDEFCSVCYERCPVPGAIELDDALPRIAWEKCTGCGICHDVCPAPENAILVAPRPSGGPAGPG
jgi:Pyruvate/2-oxoacid:ferredoxin oxidoreductase delta subunit